MLRSSFDGMMTAGMKTDPQCDVRPLEQKATLLLSNKGRMGARIWHVETLKYGRALRPAALTYPGPSEALGRGTMCWSHYFSQCDEGSDLCWTRPMETKQRTGIRAELTLHRGPLQKKRCLCSHSPPHASLALHLLNLPLSTALKSSRRA